MIGLWRVLAESHREVREQEKDDRCAIESAKAGAVATERGRAELAEEVRDRQVDASTSQSRSQIALAVQSICSSDGGGEDAGSSAGGTFLGILASNSGVLGALLSGGGKGLVDWMLGQIQPLNWFKAEAKDGETRARAAELSFEATSVPGSLEEDDAARKGALKKATDRLVELDEQRVQRSLQNAEEDRRERIALEQRMLALAKRAPRFA